MTTTLIVLAHPDRQGFCGHWAEASAWAAEAAGGSVIWSDLHAMGFAPAEGREHYGVTGRFDPLKAQETASEAGRLPADIAGEVAKLRAADRIILHFPLWWFAPPAILKGWCDRVLAHGEVHDVDHRFDKGHFRGRSALFCVTTGATGAECGPDGREGETRLLLWPLAMTFRYLGMEVLEPVCAHGVHGYHEGAEKAALEARLRGVLAGQRAVIDGWGAHPRVPFNADADFDADGRLRPQAASHTPFIRHR